MLARKDQEYLHPPYLGWQVDWPLFVKMPFTAFGKYWKKGEHFNWHTQHGADETKIAQLYGAGFVHHNRAKEKEEKVGDRLYELHSDDFLTLIRLANYQIEKVTANKNEFNRKKIKQSKILDKQRGLIRSWKANNPSLMHIYQDALKATLDKKDARVVPQETPAEE